MFTKAIFVTGEALLLISERNGPEEASRIAGVIHFFGVPCRTLTVGQFLADVAAGGTRSEKFRLFCSAGTFLELIDGLGSCPDGQPFWAERVHSAFVYVGCDLARTQTLVRRLTGDDECVLRDTDGCGVVTVSDKFDDFCAVLAGIRAKLGPGDVDLGLVFNKGKANAAGIITIGDSASLVKLEYAKVTVFLSTAKRIVDLTAALLPENFDIRDHFSSAAPIVLYVKWAFAASCWDSPRVNACLIIDDPLLKPTYGFVNFQRLLELMRSHTFSTNISFIPWNWKRSNPDVVRLFLENPEWFSLSVHGCDHTWGEFAIQDKLMLARRTKQAAERMSLHEAETGIRHDRIMVFPQGLFSEYAINFLKENKFLAAVNTTLLSRDPSPRKVEISAYWDVASMEYGAFPIFTRRYPRQGIENFAFDILLGKPCIGVIHHDFCRNGYRDLLEFVDRLNRLNCPLSWCSLGEVVRRSCRQRELVPGEVEAEVYGNEIRVENSSGRRKRFNIRRRESVFAAVKGVVARSEQLTCSHSDGYASFSIELDAGQKDEISILFGDARQTHSHEEHFKYRVKAALRRYLTETRDSYVQPLLHGVGLLK